MSFNCIACGFRYKIELLTRNRYVRNMYIAVYIHIYYNMGDLMSNRIEQSETLCQILQYCHIRSLLR